VSISPPPSDAFRPLLPGEPGGARRFRPLGAAAEPPPRAQPEPPAEPGPAPRAQTVFEDVEPPPAELPPEVRAALDGALREYAGELRRAIAAARELIERGAREVLAALAHDVLGRELQLSPVDLDAFVASALVAYGAARPVALRVAPGTPLADGVLPVRPDAALERGDLVLETPDGEIDLRIATRLRALVRDAGGR
jgi:hypothetical protein